MRMHWGKKLIEWMGDPRESFRVALHLNDKYEMDEHERRTRRAR
jgi:deoxyribodipyrimidine photo-lyase